MIDEGQRVYCHRDPDIGLSEDLLQRVEGEARQLALDQVRPVLHHDSQLAVAARAVRCGAGAAGSAAGAAGSAAGAAGSAAGSDTGAGVRACGVPLRRLPHRDEVQAVHALVADAVLDALLARELDAARLEQRPIVYGVLHLD